MKSLRQLRALLTQHEKRRFLAIVGLAGISALLEVSGVASIMPLIGLMTNPDLINTNATLAFFYNKLGFINQNQFLYFLGIVVLVLVLTSSVVRAANVYAQLRYTHMREYAIGTRLLGCYLHQPYAWFLNRHSADMASEILSEVNVVVTQTIFPLLTLISQGLAAIALLMLLLFVDPQLSLLAGAAVGGGYFLLYRYAQKHLGDIGKMASQANAKRFTAVSEAIGAIKEIKSSNTESVYLKRFANEAETYARNQASAKAFAQLPRFGMEALAFGGMVATLMYLMASQGALVKVLPIVAVFALAGYKLLPSLQQIYGAASQLRFSRSSVEKLHNDMAHAVNKISTACDKAGSRTLMLTNSLELKELCFRYPQSNQDVLKNLNLSVSAFSSVAFVGGTGSGKTTTIDVILGLLEPRSGSLLVDGLEINSTNRLSWQSQIGYVPQQIFLLDDTIAANIAFGLSGEDVDLDALHEAARLANLDEFISRELPDGYQTKIGERGVRLSGGQRQRIGIARALYRKPAVLILDEATSALDNLTEIVVMDALRNLKNKITTILIAHRLTTVKHCDSIFYLDHGRLVAHGSYEYLLTQHQGFRLLANAH